MLIHAGRRVFHFGLPTPHRSKAPVTGVDIVPRFLLSRALAPRTQRGSGKLALGPTRAGLLGAAGRPGSWPRRSLAYGLVRRWVRSPVRRGSWRPALARRPAGTGVLGCALRLLIGSSSWVLGLRIMSREGAHDQRLFLCAASLHS